MIMASLVWILGSLTMVMVSLVWILGSLTMVIVSLVWILGSLLKVCRTLIVRRDIRPIVISLFLLTVMDSVSIVSTEPTPGIVLNIAIFPFSRSKRLVSLTLPFWCSDTLSLIYIHIMCWLAMVPLSLMVRLF